MRIVDILIFLALCTWCLSLGAQNGTYRNALPEAGDVFYYKLDNLPDELIPTNSENRRVWNLSSLSAPTAHEFTFQNASKGEFSNFFPRADLVSTDVWQNEKYYEKYGSGLFIIGEVLKNTSLTRNVIIKKYSDPKPIYNEVYTLNEPQEYQSQWEIVINGTDIDDYAGDSDDLIKVAVTESIEEEVFPLGVIFLPRARYDAGFLLNRTIRSNIKILTKSGANDWVERNDLDYRQIPVKMSSQKRELVFMAESTKEWLAHVNIDDKDQVENVLFRSRKEQVVSGNGFDEEAFFMYPNPSFGLVRLDFINLPQGNYVLDVYNIIGKRLWSQTYDISDYTTIKENLGFLSKGTYLYTLSNAEGKKLFTRKMAIINP